MKKYVRQIAIGLVLILLMGLLTGCGDEPEVPTNDPPATGDVAVTDTKLTPELPWSVPGELSAPAYEEYFAGVVDYGYAALAAGGESKYTSGGNLPGYLLTYAEPSLRLESSGGELLWEVASVSGLRVVLYDESWIYGIENGTCLFRMDYYGENREDLFTDDSGLLDALNPDFVLADGKVMFFLAGNEGGGVSLWRLYLPECRADEVYSYGSGELETYCFTAYETYGQLGGEEAAEPACQMGGCFPVSSHEVVWSARNPEFYRLIAQLAEDPETAERYFAGTDLEFWEACARVETEYGVCHSEEFYFNMLTGELCRREVGYTTTGGVFEVWWVDVSVSG